MKNKKSIIRVVKFTENIVNGGKFDKQDVLKILKITNNPTLKLTVYKGILLVYYFYKFNNLPKNDLLHLDKNQLFIKCVSLLNGAELSSLEIGSLFLNILRISDNKETIRNILLGSFYGALWPFMNNPKHFETAVNYGVEILKSAFAIDKFNLFKKIKLKKNNEKILNLAGSGKKEIKLLNLSSLSAVITAAVGKKLNKNIIVEKTVSKTTSGTTGSSDIFESMGVNIDLPIKKMAKISLLTRLGIFNINKTVPKLNHIYDGRLHNVQVFAGLVGGAAVTNPVEAELISYGLTRGSNKLCLAILNKLYPDKNIIVLQGKNHKNKSVIDQFSIASDTIISQIIDEKKSFYSVTPKKFGFNFNSFRYTKSSKYPEENIKKFIRLLAGKGRKSLKQTVAMEVAFNLRGLKIVNNLKIGAKLALETINSGVGIKIMEDLVVNSNGDLAKFKNFKKLYLE